jgi:cytochrome c oxidase assembly factor CtaG
VNPAARALIAAVEVRMGRRAAERDLPGLAIAAWYLAGLVLTWLAVSVISHLGHASAHAGMDVSVVLYRSGADPLLGPLLSHRLLSTWQLDAVACAVLTIAAAGYVTGWARVHRSGEQHWPISRAISFFAGLAVCAIATNGSIAVYDMTLFSAHMIGHLLLIMIAPPLLVAGRPLRLAVAALREPWRGRLSRLLAGRHLALLTAPPVALACYTAVIVGSHLTGLMDQIMRTPWLGQVEHLVYLLVGCQFFVIILGDEPIRWRLSYPARLLLLALSMAVDTFTGLVLLQSSTPIAMLANPGLQVDPLADTHAGGAIMWVGGDGIMIVIMILLVIAWARQPEHLRRSPNSWLEQARRASFAQRVGAPAVMPSTTGESDFDEDEARRNDYNEWLRRIAKT